MDWTFALHAASSKDGGVSEQDEPRVNKAAISIKRRNDEGKLPPFLWANMTPLRGTEFLAAKLIHYSPAFQTKNSATDDSVLGEA